MYRKEKSVLSRKGMLLIFVIGLTFLCGGSVRAAYRYRLTLDGKPGSDVRPLSERALQRRSRQGIALDSTDYAISSVYLSSLEAAGLQICSRSHWLNTVVVMRPDSLAVGETYWDSFPFVKAVEQVSSDEKGLLPARRCSKWSISSSSEEIQSPYDTIGKQRALAAIDSHSTPLYELSGQVLHEAGYRGKGMLIAVVDGGFAHINRYAWLYDRVVGYRDLYYPLDPDNLFEEDTHGAQVLSVMAGDSAYGIWGTAPEAEYYLIRSELAASETPFEEDQWVAALELADSLGVDLVNSSLGYYRFDNASYDHAVDDFCKSSIYISRGAELAVSKGILLCNAAGNERNNPWRRLLFPADVEDVLTVGATDPNLRPTYFTSVGFLTPYVKPDVSCRGLQSYVIDPQTGNPTTNGGTSFASPLMCGMAASLWSAVPELSAAELRDVIRRSASQYASPDSLIGYGIPDFSVAWTLARELSAGNSLPAVEYQPSGCSKKQCIYDLMGRSLSAVPKRGCYIENGKIRMVR